MVAVAYYAKEAAPEFNYPARLPVIQ